MRWKIRPGVCVGWENAKGKFLAPVSQMPRSEGGFPLTLFHEESMIDSSSTKHSCALWTEATRPGT